MKGRQSAELSLVKVLNDLSDFNSNLSSDAVDPVLEHFVEVVEVVVSKVADPDPCEVVLLLDVRSDGVNETEPLVLDLVVLGLGRENEGVDQATKTEGLQVQSALSVQDSLVHVLRVELSGHHILISLRDDSNKEVKQDNQHEEDQ